MWRQLHAQSGGTDFYLQMGPSSHFSRSPDYMARRGLTRTKTIRLTVRCICDLLGIMHLLTLLQIISLPQNLLITNYSLGHTGSVTIMALRTFFLLTTIATP